MHPVGKTNRLVELQAGVIQKTGYTLGSIHVRTPRYGFSRILPTYSHTADLHAIGNRGYRYCNLPPGLFYFRRLVYRLRLARFCVWSGTTLRSCVHLGGRRRRKRTPLRVVGGHYAHGRAFGVVRATEMSFAACSRRLLYAAACSRVTERARNARHCV